MNATTASKSHQFLDDFIWYDIGLILIFTLVLCFFKFGFVIFRRLKAFIQPETEVHWTPSRREQDKEDQSKHSQGLPCTPNELLESYLCTKQLDRAEVLFAKIRSGSADTRADVATYNTYLRVLVENARAGNAGRGKTEELLREMESAGIEANVMTYNCLIELEIVGKDSKGVWNWFGKMPMEPDVITFSHLLSWLKDNSNAVPEEQTQKFYTALYSYVQKESLHLNEDLIVLIIDECIRASGRCKKPILDAILTHFVSQKLLLSFSCYGKLFTYFAQTKNIDKIIELHSQMEIYDLKPNEVTCGCLLEAYLSCGRIDKVIEFYESPSLVIKPFNVIIYTILVRAYAKTKSFRKIMELYKKVKAENTMQLNLIAYNTLLDCCVQCEQYGVMEEILREMIEESKSRKGEDSLVPDIITYSTIIKGLCKSQQFEKALKLYQEMKVKKMKLDEVVFNLLLNGCVKHKGAHKVAMELIEDMKQHSIPCSKYTYSILIKLYMKTNDIAKILEIYEEMKSRNVVPGVVVYTCLLQACIKAKVIVKAIEIFGDMRIQGIIPDQVAYNTMVNGCVYSGKLQNGCDALCEAMQRNVRLADDIYDNVLRNLLTYKHMSPLQKQQYATVVCNYVALNGVKVNQEHYYQVLNQLVLSPGSANGYYTGYYETPMQYQWSNYGYYYQQ